MKHFLLLATIVLIPWIGYAQNPNLGWFTNVVNGLKAILEIFIPVFIALAFLVFVWGLVVFISASGNDSAKDEGKRKMIWGVIALFVITAIWGILAILQTLTGTGSGTKHVPIWIVATDDDDCDDDDDDDC